MICFVHFPDIDKLPFKCRKLGKMIYAQQVPVRCASFQEHVQTRTGTCVPYWHSIDGYGTMSVAVPADRLQGEFSSSVLSVRSETIPAAPRLFALQRELFYPVESLPLPFNLISGTDVCPCSESLQPSWTHVPVCQFAWHSKQCKPGLSRNCVLRPLLQHLVYLWCVSTSHAGHSPIFPNPEQHSVSFHTHISRSLSENRRWAVAPHGRDRMHAD